ncbi:MAG TPA: hypothetical protein VGM87_02215 [Roseomonas sp.]|jgi:hypothetical protein
MRMAWALLRLELSLWRRHGQTPILWWRDDDARQDTPALRRLLDIAAEHGVPLLLAVVPDGGCTGLAALLHERPEVLVAQHGVTHVNRAPQGSPASEFPDPVAPDAIASAVNDGAVRLSCLPNRLPFLFVPPWNQVSPALLQGLRLAGMLQLSTCDGTRRAEAGLERLDIHLDLLRWRGGPRFRGEGPMLWRFFRLLRARRHAGAWMEPIGLLTHHLDHDAAAWDFLGRLLRVSLRGGCCRWHSPADLLGVQRFAQPPEAVPAAAPMRGDAARMAATAPLRSRRAS